MKWVGKVSRALRSLGSKIGLCHLARLYYFLPVAMQAAGASGAGGTGGGGGWGALASMVQGWLSGSQEAALAIASLLFVVGCIVRLVPAVSRRMREMGMETLENGLFLVGVVAMGAAIFAFVVSLATSFGGQGVSVESPWKGASTGPPS